jgi:hypothetical protein
LNVTNQAFNVGAKMIVTAWNNGSFHSSGAGYGLKISIPDRDRFFKREWKFIVLELEGRNSAVKINVDKASFWDETCRELISAEIGKWLLQTGLAPWSKGNPPKLFMEHIADNRFSIKQTKA